MIYAIAFCNKEGIKMASEQANNKPLRDEKGRLLPGYTANPGGRPKTKGLTEYIKGKVGEDGRELVDFYYSIFNNPEQKLDHRLEAANWLTDRGFGKAVQMVNANVNTNRVGLSELIKHDRARTDSGNTE